MFYKLDKKMITLSNGEEIAYVEKGSGEKTFILIHGNFSSCYHYEPFYKIIDDNYRVLAMDLRGYGDSSYNSPVQSIHDFADDVALFLREKNVQKAIIIGWSLGGCVAMSLASRYPEFAEKLILIASGSVKGYPVFKKNEAGLPILGSLYASKDELALDPVQVLPMLACKQNKDEEMMKNIWNMTIYTSSSKKHPTKEQNEVFIRETLKQRNLVDADWALMKFNISGEASFYSDGENIAQNIICPVLAVNGMQDLTVTKAMSDENKVAIPHLKQLYYNDCGHSVINDEPQQLLKDILNFINE